MDKLFLVGFSPVLAILLIILPLAYADNNTNTTSQNFSMIQNEGNKLGNQLMCNLYPNSCSRNAP